MLSQRSIRRADTDATEEGVMEHHKALASNNPNQRRLSDAVRGRPPHQSPAGTEVDVAVYALNRMLELGRPSHVRVA
jgi:hypothetical protein